MSFAVLKRSALVSAWLRVKRSTNVVAMLASACELSPNPSNLLKNSTVGRTKRSAVQACTVFQAGNHCRKGVVDAPWSDLRKNQQAAIQQRGIATPSIPRLRFGLGNAGLISFCVVALALSVLHPFAYANNDWENELMFEKNKLPARVPSYSFKNAEDALAGDRDDSRLISLNGVWKFKYVERSEDRPTDFMAEKFTDADWVDIPVPSNWELQSHGQPIYSNITYPFTPGILDPNLKFDWKGPQPPHPPRIYRDNPVGSYFRDFDLPSEWVNQSIILHFGGVSSAFYVWVNGKQVGYSQDSCLAAEFDVTDYVQPGTNRVAVQVFRWSDGSYLEDQDMWRLSGIQREGLLLAQPKISLNDFYIRTKFDEQLGDAKLQIRPRVWVKEPEDELDGWRITAQLFDADSVSVLSEPLSVSVKEIYNERWAPRDVEKFALMEANIKRPLKWSAEHPDLYKLVFTVIDPSGDVAEARSQSIGFRQIKVSEQNELLINGKSVKIMGVNRHDHSPVRGKSLTRDEMRKDVELLKQFNFNAVRTSHYPNDPYFYELCDRYGIYVMDEANIECHHLGSYIPQQPGWALPILSRVFRMAERDKNHPCIIFWSLGNESGTGPAFAAAAAWVRDFDPSRLIHYEGAQGDPTDPEYVEGFGYKSQQAATMANPDDPDYVDVVSRMYPLHEQVVNLANNPRIDRPIILCEYLHAMGNSIGTLGEFWDTIREKPNLIGGFIWDMIDQGIEQTHESGQKFYAYGGDFGDMPNDGNFCFNGVFASDRTPNPHAWECRYIFQPATFADADIEQGFVRITNRFDFTNLDQYEIRWTLSRNGEELQSGVLDAQDIPAGGSVTVRVPYRKVKFDKASEYWLRLSLHETTDRLWCKKGWEISKNQIVVHGRTEPGLHVSTLTEVITHEETDQQIAITGKSFSVAVSKTNGELSSWKVDGVEQLASALRPNFWRPMTDNDRRFRQFLNKKKVWREIRDKLKTVSVKLLHADEKSVVVLVKQKYWNKLTLDTKYTCFNDGSILVAMDLDADPSLPDLPKFGVTLGIPAQYTHTTYYGNGPWESYSDRKRGVEVDEFSVKTDDMFYNYAMPQENGNRTETRWVKLTDQDNRSGVVITGLPQFNFSVWPYSAGDIEDAKHPFDLMPQGFYTLNIDLAQTGVGGMRAVPKPHQLVQSGKHSFKFAMSPYDR